MASLILMKKFSLTVQTEEESHNVGVLLHDMRSYGFRCHETKDIDSERISYKIDKTNPSLKDLQLLVESLRKFEERKENKNDPCNEADVGDSKARGKDVAKHEVFQSDDNLKQHGRSDDAEAREVGSLKENCHENLNEFHSISKPLQQSQRDECVPLDLSFDKQIQADSSSIAKREIVQGTTDMHVLESLTDTNTSLWSEDDFEIISSTGSKNTHGVVSLDEVNLRDQQSSQENMNQRKRPGGKMKESETSVGQHSQGNLHCGNRESEENMLEKLHSTHDGKDKDPCESDAGQDMHGGQDDEDGDDIESVIRQQVQDIQEKASNLKSRVLDFHAQSGKFVKAIETEIETTRVKKGVSGMGGPSVAQYRKDEFSKVTDAAIHHHNVGLCLEISDKAKADDHHEKTEDLKKLGADKVTDAAIHHNDDGSSRGTSDKVKADNHHEKTEDLRKLGADKVTAEVLEEGNIIKENLYTHSHDDKAKSDVVREGSMNQTCADTGRETANKEQAASKYGEVETKTLDKVQPMRVGGDRETEERDTEQRGQRNFPERFIDKDKDQNSNEAREKERDQKRRYHGYDETWEDFECQQTIESGHERIREADEARYRMNDHYSRMPESSTDQKGENYLNESREDEAIAFDERNYRNESIMKKGEGQHRVNRCHKGNRDGEDQDIRKSGYERSSEKGVYQQRRKQGFEGAHEADNDEQIKNSYCDEAKEKVLYEENRKIRTDRENKIFCIGASDEDEEQQKMNRNFDRTKGGENIHPTGHSERAREVCRNCLTDNRSRISGMRDSRMTRDEVEAAGKIHHLQDFYQTSEKSGNQLKVPPSTRDEEFSETHGHDEIKATEKFHHSSDNLHQTRDGRGYQLKVPPSTSDEEFSETHGHDEIKATEKFHHSSDNLHQTRERRSKVTPTDSDVELMETPRHGMYDRCEYTRASERQQGLITKQEKERETDQMENKVSQRKKEENREAVRPQKTLYTKDEKWREGYRSEREMSDKGGEYREASGHRVGEIQGVDSTEDERWKEGYRSERGMSDKGGKYREASGHRVGEIQGVDSTKDERWREGYRSEGRMSDKGGEYREASGHHVGETQGVDSTKDERWREGYRSERRMSDKGGEYREASGHRVGEIQGVDSSKDERWREGYRSEWEMSDKGGEYRAASGHRVREIQGVDPTKDERRREGHRSEREMSNKGGEYRAASGHHVEEIQGVDSTEDERWREGYRSEWGMSDKGGKYREASGHRVREIQGVDSNKEHQAKQDLGVYEETNIDQNMPEAFLRFESKSPGLTLLNFISSIPSKIGCPSVVVSHDMEARIIYICGEEKNEISKVVTKIEDKFKEKEIKCTQVDCSQLEKGGFDVSSLRHGESVKQSSSRKDRHDRNRTDTSWRKTYNQTSEKQTELSSKTGAQSQGRAYSSGGKSGLKSQYAGSSVDDPHCNKAEYSKDRFKTKHCDIDVKVEKADITSLHVDAIVNAANTRLQHGGGVAKAIATKAGYKLKNECDEHTKRGQNNVPVTDMFVSTGGWLCAKFVFHAVGPMWKFYGEDKKAQCATDLRNTVLRCLVEAGARDLRTIALPSISAAIFKVPLEICTKAYLEAVQIFDAFNKNTLQSNLKEIRFVDINETLVDAIQTCFRSGWEEEPSFGILRNGYLFAEEHLSSRDSQSHGNQTGPISREAKRESLRSKETAGAKSSFNWSTPSLADHTAKSISHGTKREGSSSNDTAGAGISINRPAFNPADHTASNQSTDPTSHKEWVFDNMLLSVSTDPPHLHSPDLIFVIGDMDWLNNIPGRIVLNLKDHYQVVKADLGHYLVKFNLYGWDTATIDSTFQSLLNEIDRILAVIWMDQNYTGSAMVSFTSSFFHNRRVNNEAVQRIIRNMCIFLRMVFSKLFTHGAGFVRIAAATRTVPVISQTLDDYVRSLNITSGPDRIVYPSH